MKALLYYLLTCFVVALVLAPIMDSQALSNRDNFYSAVLFGFCYSTSGLYVSVWLFQYLDRKFDWTKNIVKRIVIGVIVVEVWSLLTYIVISPPLIYITSGASFDRIMHEMRTNYYLPLLMGLPGMLIIASIEFFKYWKSSYLKQEKLKAEMMSYKYAALRNQLNPHFIFNSFNVLNSLVYENPQLAVTFLDQLSDVYKRVLNNKDKDLVTLSEELEFVESYIYLLKTRFEDKLKIDIKVNAGPDEYIAPMVIQLLIENAVKHNVISTLEPLVISIEKNGNVIESRNIIRRKKAGDESSGMGLVNIRQRYSLLTNLPVEVSNNNGFFVVRIPILLKRR